MEKIEKILRSQTVNLFNDSWYENTVRMIDGLKVRTKGYVYLIQTKDNANIKVGMSINLTNRLKSFNSSMGGNIKLVGFIYCENYQELEKEIHIEYNEKRIVGEWFRLSSKDCENIIENYNGVTVNKFFYKDSRVIDGLCLNFEETISKTVDSYYYSFMNFCDKNIHKGIRYSKKELNNELNEVDPKYTVLSPKKFTMMIKKWCDINNYKYNDLNTNGVRGFFIV